MHFNTIQSTNLTLFGPSPAVLYRDVNARTDSPIAAKTRRARIWYPQHNFKHRYHSCIIIATYFDSNVADITHRHHRGAFFIVLGMARGAEQKTICQTALKHVPFCVIIAERLLTARDHWPSNNFRNGQLALPAPVDVRIMQYFGTMGYPATATIPPKLALLEDCDIIIHGGLHCGTTPSNPKKRIASPSQHNHREAQKRESSQNPHRLKICVFGLKNNTDTHNSNGPRFDHIYFFRNNRGHPPRAGRVHGSAMGKAITQMTRILWFALPTIIYLENVLIIKKNV